MNMIIYGQETHYLTETATKATLCYLIRENLCPLKDSSLLLLVAYPSRKKNKNTTWALTRR